MNRRILFIITALGQTLMAQNNWNQSGDPSIYSPVTADEVDRLRRDIAERTRSSVELIGEYHSESGDLNNRLDFWRAGARLNYRLPPRSLLYVSGARSEYMTQNNFLNGNGLNVTAGVRTSFAESVDGQFEVGATRFNSDHSTVNVLASLSFRASDAVTFFLTGSRANVEETLLSATGLRPTAGPFAGKLVGAVMDNRGTAGLAFKLPLNLDLTIEGGAGVRNGSNVDSNFFRHARAGAGYNIVSGAPDQSVSLLRAGYQFQYFGFDQDRLGFGGASLLSRSGRSIALTSLGGDGVSPVPAAGRAGIGGYFSPERFTANIGRVDLQGQAAPALRYRLSGFAGSQSYTGSDLRQAYGFSGTIEFVLNDRFSLPVTLARDNYGPFTQQTVWARLVMRL